MKDFKKIIFAIVGFVVCFLVFDFGVGRFFDWAMTKMPSEGERVAKSYFSLNKVEADVIIVGSSRAETGYNSKILMDSLQNHTVNNCGGDGQGFFYTNILVNSILDRYSPKAIIWDFRERELGGKAEENLSLVYPYYWRDEYIRQELDFMEGSCFKFRILFNAYRYNATAGRILRSMTKRGPECSYGFAGRPATQATKTIIPRDFEIKDDQLDSIKVKKFIATANRMKACGCKLIVIVSPMYNYYNEDNFYTRENRKICDDLGALYIDDSHMEGFIHNNEYTFDEYHLNIKGANEFTRRLVGQIREYLTGCVAPSSPVTME